jgi:hypothetical protein
VESIRNSRPSVPAAVFAPASTSWLASAAKAAQAYALGQPAVNGATLIGSADVLVRTAPTFGGTFTGSTTSKSVMGTGTTMSILAANKVSAARDHQVQLDKVGGVKVRKNDARGIPPRGRPV